MLIKLGKQKRLLDHYRESRNNRCASCYFIYTTELKIKYMKVTTKELFTQQYDVVGITLHRFAFDDHEFDTDEIFEMLMK